MSHSKPTPKKKAIPKEGFDGSCASIYKPIQDFVGVSARTGRSHFNFSCGVWTNVGRCRHQPGAIGLYAVRPRAVFEELKPLHQSFRSDAKEKQTWDIPQWQTKPSLFRDPMFCWRWNYSPEMYEAQRPTFTFGHCRLQVEAGAWFGLPAFLFTLTSFTASPNWKRVNLKEFPLILLPNSTI